MCFLFLYFRISICKLSIHIVMPWNLCENRPTIWASCVNIFIYAFIWPMFIVWHLYHGLSTKWWIGQILVLYLISYYISRHYYTENYNNIYSILLNQIIENVMALPSAHSWGISQVSHLKNSRLQTGPDQNLISVIFHIH